MSNHEELYEQLAGVAPIHRCEDGPVFNEPWQAHAFALTVALHERGHFTWPEWAICFSTVIATAQKTSQIDTQESYYLLWLSALEKIIADKGLSNRIVMTSRYEAWTRATKATPHGEQIRLQNDPEFTAEPDCGS